MKTSILPALQKAVRAARKAYGACRYGDVASVHRCAYKASNARHAPCVGYVVCPRVRTDGDTFIASVHSAAGFLPQESAILVCVYHDTLKG